MVAVIISGERLVFGEPRPGFQPLAHPIAAIRDSRSDRAGKLRRSKARRPTWRIASRNSNMFIAICSPR
jgi:hypothetical protein